MIPIQRDGNIFTASVIINRHMFKGESINNMKSAILALAGILEDDGLYHEAEVIYNMP